MEAAQDPNAMNPWCWQKRSSSVATIASASSGGISAGRSAASGVPNGRATNTE